MKDQENEVFNVVLQSTRPDGYRRGGFSLTRGINRLENVTRPSIIQFKRDTALLVLEAEPVGVGKAETRVSINVSIPAGSSAENAGAQSLDAGGMSVSVDNLHLNAGSVNLSADSLNQIQNDDTQRLNDGEKTLAERLAALIPQLTPEQYTQGGVPDAKALAALAGEPVSAADRDAAFALYQQIQMNGDA